MSQGEKRDAVKQFILDRLASGDSPSLKQIAADLQARGLKVSVATVAHARRELRAEGKIGDLPHTPSRFIAPTQGAPDLLVVDAAELTKEEIDALPAERVKEMLQRVIGGETQPLTLEQHRALLAEMALHGSDQIRIRAQEADLKFIAAAGTGKDIGPDPPLTEEEVVFETSMILEAAGPELAARAWRVAFTHAEMPS